MGVLNDNPYFTGGDGSTWAGVNGTFSVSSSPPAGSPYAYAGFFTITTAAPGAAAKESAASGPFAAVPAAQYLLTAWVYTAQTSVTLGFDWLDGSHDAPVQRHPVCHRAGEHLDPGHGRADQPGQHRLGDGADRPGGRGRAHPLLPGHPGAAPGAGLAAQAGTVTATQIAANTITAAQIAASTITATQIAANTITGGQIAAGTITASKISSGTITAGLLAAGIVKAGIVDSTTITAATWC